MYLKEWGEKPPLGFAWGTLNGSTRFGHLHNLSITQDYEGIRAKWKTRAHRMSRKALAYRLSFRVLDFRDMADGGYAEVGWRYERFTRFVWARLNWRQHRSRLGVKLLDFSSN